MCDAPSAATPATFDPGSFFRVKDSFILQHMRHLTRSELAVYLAIAKGTCRQNGRTQAGIDYLGNLAGIKSPKHVRTALRELTAKGLVVRESAGGGRENRSIYVIPDPPALKDQTGAQAPLFTDEPEAQTGAQAPLFTGQTGAQAPSKGGRTGSLKGCPCAPPIQRSLSKGSFPKEEDSPRHAAAAALDGESGSIKAKARAAHAAAVAWWCGPEGWELVEGRKYHFDGGRDGKHVRRILEWTGIEGEVEQFKRIARVYLRDSSPYFRTHPLAKLAGNVEEFRAKLGTAKSGANHGTSNDDSGCRVLPGGGEEPLPSSLRPRLEMAGRSRGAAG